MWLPVQESPTYLVSDDGRVYSTKSEKVLSPGLGTNGRPLVNLPIDGKFTSRYIHVLVCSAFHGPRPGRKYEASHLDGNILNNSATNLAWETRSENLGRRVDHGTHDRGVQNSRAVFTEEDLVTIRTRKDAGDTMTSIAKDLGVSRTSVSRVLNGHRYG